MPLGRAHPRDTSPLRLKLIFLYNNLNALQEQTHVQHPRLCGQVPTL